MQCPDPRHLTSPRPLFPRGEVDFRVCPECSLAFRDVFPTRSELALIYDEAYSSDSIAVGHTNQESGDYALIAYGRFLAGRLLRPGIRVLDFGAATGALVSHLRQNGLEADGFEFSEPAREHCAERRGFQLFGDLTAIPRNSYDLITMIEVIEHLTDLPGTLRTLREALRPGGRLFVTTPNRRGWRAIIEGGNWREAQKKFHLFLFDDRSLRHHLQVSGFMPQRVRFSPVLKSGLQMWLVSRCMQLLGLGGTLCFVAGPAKQPSR